MIRESYQDVISNIFDKVNKLKDDKEVYFNTITFRPISSPLAEKQIQYCFDSYDACYNHICSKIVKNYSRASKQNLLPVTFDFIDASCSTKKKNIRTFISTPHIHSITLVPKSVSAKYEKYILFHLPADLRTLTQMKNHKIPIRPFQSKLQKIADFHIACLPHQDIEKTLAYSSKLLQHPIAENNSLMTMYPVIKPTSSSYYSNSALSSTHPI